MTISLINMENMGSAYAHFLFLITAPAKMALQTGAPLTNLPAYHKERRGIKAEASTRSIKAIRIITVKIHSKRLLKGTKISQIRTPICLSRIIPVWLVSSTNKHSFARLII
jgi:hypothetical protein